ncbi:MAG TPA: Dabb family protein [Planctomycetota bacterium]|nr:Dabb family protein [Planctomycetota bacterium]HRR81435.1 Dabb family protein [Planctomycetota bacterium]
MKRMLGAGILGLLLTAGCCPFTRVCPIHAQTTRGKVRHVVLFKFKAEATPQQIKAVEEGFRALPAKISGIRYFEWGTDISPEKLSDGFTHCFLVTFDTEKARDAYLPHPAHKAFVEVLKPILDKVLVVDYVAQR